MFNARPIMQKTLKAPIHCTGIGLHSGVQATLTLRPASADTGIVFRRLDGATGSVEIPATWEHAVESALCTMLTDGLADGKATTIMTIEHLMAAISGCGLDNAVVEILGPEVPAMDGSAAPFVALIDSVGLVEQFRPRRFVKVLKTIEVAEGQARVRLSPQNRFTVEFEIDFASAAIGRQRTCLDVEPEAFKEEVSDARTFGFLKEVEMLRKAGRALGGSLDNSVVIDGDTVLNAGGLRYEDEFVRHKALDAVGDLLLAGTPLLARFQGVRSSHALTRRALAALFSDAAAWTYVTCMEPVAEKKVRAEIWNDEAAWAEPARALA